MSIEKRIKVKIDWRIREEGGRESIINALHYRPTIIIPQLSTRQHWSFFLDFYSIPQFNSPVIAEGTFLSEYAESEPPWNSMPENTIFFVMEGSKKVADGIVIEGPRDIDLSNLPSYPSLR